MMLKKIKLENIRSYEQEEIVFSKGSTLLSGDIGCGKTSVLLAIEFALFGLQPGQRGSSLLKNGVDTGAVTIDLEIDGNEIIIHRTLKRSKTITQDYCYIEINGEKKELSVMELKDNVLSLLNYPKEFSKKQNILYKFTVYTPQEEMKQIILEDPKTRLNTLRHVFGVDKYKKILENMTIILQKIREEKRFKTGMIMGLESDKELFGIKETDLQDKKNNLIIAQNELSLKIAEKIDSEKDLPVLKEKIENKRNIDQEMGKTKILASTKKDSVLDNERTIQNLKSELELYGDKIFDEGVIKILEEEITLLKHSKVDLNEKNIDLASKIASLSSKNQESDDLKKNISSMEFCPTCLQDVADSYKSNVMNKTENDISRNVKQIGILVLEKREVSTKLGEVEFSISQKEAKIQELKLEKIKLQGQKEKEIRVADLEKLNISLKKDVDLLERHLEDLQQSSFEFSKFERIFEEKQNEIEIKLKKERASEIIVAELTREINVFEDSINELAQRIEKTQKVKEELNHLNGLEAWLSMQFIPVISNIEKNVMMKLKSEFSKIFSEWFKTLVSDTFEVKLSDDFTPIIEQHDYELDYSYLSGGERTAVALAYRLALNQVINSLMSKIKTKDLVILDEPTDGFSNQQLDKMREVLDQLNVAQLLIVSHEQKMEGFVENVIRFSKENGISRKE